MKSTIRTKCNISSRKSRKPEVIANTINALEATPRLKTQYHRLAADIAETVALYTSIEHDRYEITGAYLLKLGFVLAQNGIKIYKDK